jgi:arylsulfatase A-like enzyme
VAVGACAHSAPPASQAEPAPQALEQHVAAAPLALSAGYHPGVLVASNGSDTPLPAKKPNIVVIWGDDIGQSNLSAYSNGVMGYRTPNIDRIAHEGMMFTDYYAEQSCTAGRAAFITGQSVFRTGLSKVGMPGAEAGMRKEDPTIAALLKGMGYTTGQFGKNHLGDRDEMLPSNHGFDEFYGNLYHLNAEEEPELRDYPKDPEFRKKFGPRGVIHSYADGRIEDTGPLTKKRMETIDDDTAQRSAKFIEVHRSRTRTRLAAEGKRRCRWRERSGRRSPSPLPFSGRAGRE